MEKEILIQELEKIKTYYFDKGDYVSYNQVGRAIDVAEDYYFDINYKSESKNPMKKMTKQDFQNYIISEAKKLYKIEVLKERKESIDKELRMLNEGVNLDESSNKYIENYILKNEKVIRDFLSNIPSDGYEGINITFDGLRNLLKYKTNQKDNFQNEDFSAFLKFDENGNVVGFYDNFNHQNKNFTFHRLNKPFDLFKELVITRGKVFESYFGSYNRKISEFLESFEKLKNKMSPLSNAEPGYEQEFFATPDEKDVKLYHRKKSPMIPDKDSYYF